MIGSEVRSNTGWALGGLILRLGAQSVYFWLLARTLGSGGYGAFVSTLAMASLVTPLASLGAGQLLIQNVARDRAEFSAAWGTALKQTTLFSGALGLVMAVIASFLLPKTIPLPVIAAVMLSDVVFASLISIASQSYQAIGDLRRTAAIQLCWSLLKLAAASVMFLNGRSDSMVAWGFLYLAATAVSGVGAVWLVCREIGAPSFTRGISLARVQEGTYFALGESAKTIYDDADKALLARYAALDVVGQYGAAYRLLELSLAPVRALLSATYTGFFRSGATGILGALTFGRPYFLAAAAYGAGASLAIFLAAPLLPSLLGAEYAGAVVVLRWLSILPLLKSCHYVAADALTGAGLQRLRALLQFSIAAINIILCVALLPRFGWKGAAAISLLSDGTLLLLLVVAIAIRASPRRNQQAQLSQI